MFIYEGGSWHFVPIWEFTFFMSIFCSTRCLALFHVLLTNITSYIWLKIFYKMGFKKSGIIAVILLTISLYIRNFTVPALKDALVYFLFTICVLYMEEVYLEKRYKSLLLLILPILVLTFLRMYVAGALIASIMLIVFLDAQSVLRGKITFKIIGIIILLIAMLISFIGTPVYEYANTWVGKLHLGLGIMIVMIKRIIDFLYGPFCLNVFLAPSMYYPSYIESTIRLFATPWLIRGYLKLRHHQGKKSIYVVLVFPLLLCMLALEAGGMDSPIRQIMCFYPLLCILYGLGYVKGNDYPL